MNESVKAAQREVKFWIAGEDFVRWIGMERPGQSLSRRKLVVFTRADWIAFSFRTKDTSEEAATRAFERWKQRARACSFVTAREQLGSIARDDVDLVARGFEVGVGGIYVVRTAGLKARVQTAIARRDELAAAFRAMRGGKAPRVKRDVSLNQAAVALGVCYTTLRRWVRFSGAPATKIKVSRRGRRGGCGFEYRVNVDELEAWAAERASSGAPVATSDDQRFRLPVAEAAERIEAARKKVNVNKAHFAELLRISKSTLYNIYRTPPAVQTVRLSLVTQAEELVGSEHRRVATGSQGAPVGRSARITPDELRGKIKEANGSLIGAGRLFDPPISSQTVRRLAEAYEINWNRQTEPLVLWLSSKEIVECLKEGRSVAAAARLAGVSPSAMRGAIEKYGLQEEADRHCSIYGQQIADKDMILAALSEVDGDVYKAAESLGYRKVTSLVEAARKYGLGDQLVFRKKCAPGISREDMEAAIKRAKKEGLGITALFRDLLGTGTRRGWKIARELGLEDCVGKLNQRPTDELVAKRRRAFRAMLKRAIKSRLSLKEAIERSGMPRSTFMKRVGEYGLHDLAEPLRLESNKRRAEGRRRAARKKDDEAA
jgi:DNA-binding transcriptional regulator YiaG